MTFDSREKSTEQSRPIELYEFAIQSQVFRWHNVDDAEIIFNGEVFTPEAISRTSLVARNQDRDPDLTISVPRDNEFAQLYVDIVPGQRASFTLRRFQRVEGTGDFITSFKGFVQSVGYSKNTRQADILVRSIESASSRPIPRFGYQGLCNHVLYDSRCKVVETLFRFDGTVSAVSGSTITVPGVNGEADGYYNGGFVFFPSINDYRLVLTHVGNDLTLLLPFPTDAVGGSVQVFAGCDHTIAVCKSKFDNVINYGGFAFVPTKNIFETGIT